MRRLSDATSRVVSHNFSRKFVSIGRIVKAWDDIMGVKMAEKAVPYRIQYRKGKSKTDKPVAILEIATSQADATMLHYQKDVILERITSVFGEAWIADIKFVSLDLKTKEKPLKKRSAPLTATQKNHLSSLLSSVEDEAIYQRLQALGEGVLKEHHES